MNSSSQNINPVFLTKNDHIVVRIFILLFQYKNDQYFTSTQISEILRNEGFSVSRRTVDSHIQHIQQICYYCFKSGSLMLTMEEITVRVGPNLIPAPAYCLVDNSNV
jgi:hypothetical protein